MASSNTYNFSLDIGTAIIQACAMNSLSTTALDSTEQNLLQNAANLIFGDWINRLTPNYEQKFVVQPLTQGQVSFTLPVGAVDVYNATIRQYDFEANPIDAPVLERINRMDYLTKPDKLSQGTPTQFFLDRQLTPIMYLYFVPDSDLYSVAYYYGSQIADVTSQTQLPDIPYRWQNAFVAALAVHVAFLKGNSDNLLKLQANYEAVYEAAAGEERDKSNISVDINMSSYTRSGL